MIQTIGIIGLILFFVIFTPLYEKMSYKSMYKQGERNEREQKDRN